MAPCPLLVDSIAANPHPATVSTVTPLAVPLLPRSPVYLPRIRTSPPAPGPSSVPVSEEDQRKQEWEVASDDWDQELRRAWQSFPPPVARSESSSPLLRSPTSVLSGYRRSDPTPSGVDGLLSRQQRLRVQASHLPRYAQSKPARGGCPRKMYCTPIGPCFQVPLSNHVPYFQVSLSNLHGNSKTSLPGAVLQLDATPTASNLLEFVPSMCIVRILPQPEYLSVL
jgi:hypothetical protein